MKGNCNANADAGQIIDILEIEGLTENGLPDPALLEYYRRIQKREILWNDDIDDCSIDISMYIKKWNEEDKGIPSAERKPIKIFINSIGGATDVVMHIIDMIHLSKTPVITIGLGRVYSAGGLLLMAGHKRYIFEHTTCLIHDGSFGAAGSTGKLLDNLKFTESQEQYIKQYVTSKTQITESAYEDNYRRDWFLFSDEMIRLGVADEIVTDIDTIL